MQKPYFTCVKTEAGSLGNDQEMRPSVCHLQQNHRDSGRLSVTVSTYSPSKRVTCRWRSCRRHKDPEQRKTPAHCQVLSPAQTGKPVLQGLAQLRVPQASLWGQVTQTRCMNAGGGREHKLPRGCEWGRGRTHSLRHIKGGGAV